MSIDQTSMLGLPSTIHSAMILPMPPAPAIPWALNPGARALKEWGESAPVRFEELVVEVRWSALEGEGGRAPAVASGHHVALVGTEVDQVVGVPHCREVS